MGDPFVFTDASFPGYIVSPLNSSQILVNCRQMFLYAFAVVWQ